METQEQLLEQLEDDRLTFTRFFRKIRYINYAVLAIFIIGMVVMFYILKDSQSDALLIVMGVLIFGLFTYSRIFKGWVNSKTYAYIFSSYRTTATYFYLKEPFDEVSINEREGFDIDEFRQLGILDDVTGLISRNQITGRINDINFLIADAGARTRTNKKVRAAFFGRIIKIDLKKEANNHFIAHFRADNWQDLPASFSKYKQYEADEQHILVSDDGKKATIYTKPLEKLLFQLQLDETLFDVTFIVKGHNAYLLLSYNEQIMNTLYLEKATPEPFIRYQKDLNIIVDIIKLINK